MTSKYVMDRWRDCKFGMFIHYGLYSIRGEGEWAMWQQQIPRTEYAKLAQEFTAENFDAKHLAELAKKAGMRYMVLTSRHHDGFCLFDSKHSIGDFTVANTPCGRDLIREYTDACRAEGLLTGLYYSPMDWRCEGFFFPLMYHDSALQMRAQCHAQVKELVENYGKIDILWYDGGEDHWLAHAKRLHLEPDQMQPADFKTNHIIPNFWGEDEVNALVRDRQPEIVVDNRFGARRHGDYVTPERVVGGFNVVDPWETCDTISESWGWMPNTRLRPMEEVIHLLIDVITGGGNLLLNVSPRGDGSLEPEHEARLLEIGAWLERYGEAVYGTRGGPVHNNKQYGGAVWKDDKVWFHIKNPACTHFRLPVSDMAVKEVTAITGETCSYSLENGVLTVLLPETGRAPVATVVRVTLDGSAERLGEIVDTDTFDAFA